MDQKNTHQDPFVVNACHECSGSAEDISVHFLSGEVVQVERVTDVHVMQDEIILQPAEGPARAFTRSDVYYAGCAHCPPPFPS